MNFFLFLLFKNLVLDSKLYCFSISNLSKHSSISVSDESLGNSSIFNSSAKLLRTPVGIKITGLLN